MNAAPRYPSRRKQRGAATLVAAGALLSVITVVTLTVGRTNVAEQQIAGNDQVAKDLRHAAEAGLEFGMAWISKGNKPTWTTSGSTQSYTLPSGTVPTTTAGNDAAYTPVVKLVRRTAATEQSFIQVVSTVTLPSGSKFELSEYVLGKQTINTTGPDAYGPNQEPIVVKGCIGGATGTSDVYVDPSPLGIGNGKAIATSTSSGLNGNDYGCIDTGLGGEAEATGSGIQLHNCAPGSNRVAECTNFDSVPNTPTGAWDYTFDVDLDTVKGMADGQNIIVVSDPSPFHDSLGTPTDPVILIFDSTAGCPKINGGPVIYGLVYYESASSCDSQGWGGATIYGSVIFEGGISKFTSNAEIRNWDYADGDPTDGDNIVNEFGYIDSIPIIGTWTDVRP